MNRSTTRLKYRIRIVAIIIAAITSGASLFLGAALFQADSELLSPSRHMQLMSKYDIYSKLGTVIGKTTRLYIANSGGQPSKSEAPQNTMQSLVENAVKPDMIKLNINNLVNGMLGYFKGDSDFLPDIYLRPVQNNKTEVPVTDTPSTGSATDSSSAFGPMSGMDIDKVNLSAVLMYTNRPDISDSLAIIRLLHSAAADIPAILLVIGLFCLLCAASLIKTKAGYIKLMALVAGTAGFLGMLSGCFLYYLIKVLLPVLTNSFGVSFPLPVDIITGYIQDLAIPVVLFSTFIALLFPLSFLLFKALKGHVKVVEDVVNTGVDYKNGKIIHLRLLVFVTLAVVLLIAGILKTSVFVGDLRENGFAAAYEKMTGSNTQMKVIPAMNDTVYTLEVKLLDKSSGNPVTGVLIEVEGKTASSKTDINLNKTAGSEGSARFSIEAGNFTISFTPEMFPAGYKIPSPIIVSVSTAGTTTLTINLERLT